MHGSIIGVNQTHNSLRPNIFFSLTNVRFWIEKVLNHKLLFSQNPQFKPFVPPSIHPSFRSDIGTVGPFPGLVYKNVSSECGPECFPSSTLPRPRLAPDWCYLEPTWIKPGRSYWPLYEPGKCGTHTRAHTRLIHGPLQCYTRISLHSLETKLAATQVVYAIPALVQS